MMLYKKSYNQQINDTQILIIYRQASLPSKFKCVRSNQLRLPAVGTLKGYSKALEYEYRVKTAALGTIKRYSIISLTLYLEWYNAYSIVGSGGPY
jgi:hypothetical protein